ncbi:MAG: plasmid mobilization relaxosome protein MobC [Arenicella sp.]
MRSRQVAKPRLSSSFSAVSLSKAKRNKKPETKPFCVRLTDDERAELETIAGKMPLGRFLREQLLGSKARKRKKRSKVRQPKIGDKNLALVMALFGDQRIASNLNQLARHANMGTLDFDDETLEQIQEACAAMIAVRNYLLGD